MFLWLGVLVGAINLMYNYPALVMMSFFATSLAFAHVPALPVAIFEPSANQSAIIDTDTLNQQLPPAQSISIDNVNQKLDMRQTEQNNNTPIFATFTDLYDQKTQHTSVMRLDDPTSQQTNNPQPTTQTPSHLPNDDKAGIDPNAYLPAYDNSHIAPVAVITTDTDNTPKKPKAPSLPQRLYNRLFNDGVAGLSRLSAKVYLTQSAAQTSPTDTLKTDHFHPETAWHYENPLTNSLSQYSQHELILADNKQQPFKNIIAALENITQESVNDFQIALPRLREAVDEAARAVGYYEVQFYLKNADNGRVEVIVYDLGNPTHIASQAIDIRGEGANFFAFEEIQEKAPKIGETFNHGDYETTKAKINATQAEYGFFDGRWLNHSADVILPDGIADVSLVYDSGQQYAFDEVIFFTLDETGNFTTDPDKLPVEINLLKKMVTFQAGEPFNRSAITKLSNHLSATRYFNTANIDAVYPNAYDNDQDNAISFAQEQNQNSTKPTNTPTDDTTMVLDNQNNITAEVSPIDFSPSQAMLDKLNLVSAKAKRLLNSPDNRILDESKKGTDSLLGQISHAVSHLATKILPDESDDDKPLLPIGTTPSLTNKKTPKMVHQDKKVPLYVFVTADKPKNAQLGIGWGSDTGARLTARLENHLINRQGFQAGADLALSKRLHGVNLFFSRPLSHPVNDKLTANFKYLEQKIDQGTSGFDLSTKTLEQGLSRTIIKENDWHQIYTLRYRLDALNTKAPKETWQDLPVNFVASKENQEVVLAGAAISRVVQNAVTAPTWGYRQYHAIEVGSQALRSDTNLAILRTNLGAMASFGDNIWGQKRAHQLIGKLDLGYIWADNFELVPYKLRFFAGGDNSLRGYSYESLSPISPAGYLLGGQALAIGSLEYNYEILENIRVALFTDFGNAYDKKFQNDTKIALGLGVRWASPVGVVRADIAKGVGDDKKETPIKLHFLIGLPF